MIVHAGVLVVAGIFTTGGGNPANHVAGWDGSAWQQFGIGWGSGNLPGPLLAELNGDVVIAANDSQPQRWNGTAWVDLGTWVSGGTQVEAMTVFGGDLYVTGPFATNNPAPAQVARSNGSTWQALPPLAWTQPSTTTIATSLVVFEGSLWAGWRFESVFGINVTNRAYRWDGAAWQDDPAKAIVGATSIAVNDGQFYVLGSFETRLNGNFPNNTALHSIAKWNGTALVPVGGGVNDWVLAFAEYRDALIAGGKFTQAPGVAAANRVVAWDGASWQPLGSGMPDQVKALATCQEDLYAGGLFTTAGGVAATGIARWNGASWAPVGAGVGGSVLALTVWNGELIAAGTFFLGAGGPGDCLARWNGTSWQPIPTGLSLPPPFAPLPAITTLAVYNGDLYVGGTFTSIAGVAANHVARWDGTAFHALGTGLTAPWQFQVTALEPFGGELIIGGGFNQAGGIPAQWIARWNGSTFQPMGTQINSEVRALHVYQGQLIAGGTFTPDHVVRWDGASWHPLGTRPRTRCWRSPSFTAP